MIAPIEFQTKWATIGAIIVSVYYNSNVIKTLIEITLITGIIPASNAPACIKVNNAVVKTIATTTF